MPPAKRRANGMAAASPSDGAKAARPAPKRDRSQDIGHKWSCFKLQAARRGIVQALTLDQFSTCLLYTSDAADE